MLWRVKTRLSIAALLLAVVSGCAADAAGTPTPSPGEYLPGHAVTVDLPQGDPGAVVVLVPGGAWLSADPTGLRPLAATLTEADLAVVTITYGTHSQRVHYPGPVDDVACAVAYAAQEVPGVPVVLVGHSAGAHLVTVAGLRPEREAECPYPAHAADAVVGLAGPYDVATANVVAQNLFGMPLSEDGALWRDGNPFTWVDERLDLPFLLVHGEEDRDVALFFTTDLADALTEAGHEVTVEVVPGADHHDIYTPEVVADLLVTWIGGLAG